jgi:hypothetical protein
LVETIETARSIGGELLAIDGPEYVVARGLSVRNATEYVGALNLGLRAAGVMAVANLNSSTPPSWAGELAAGPLFEPNYEPGQAAVPAEAVDELFELLLADSAQGSIQLVWHVGERDWLPEGRGRLSRIVRRALEGAPLAFAFDRPRTPLALAEGIDRRHPAVLLTVGLHLPRLAAQTGATAARDPERLLGKLGSLGRMALSAGVQKRAFLRRHGRDWPAFLLDRARLVVVPVGLDCVARVLTGAGITAGGPGLEFAQQVIARLDATLTRDGQASRLDTCLAAALGPRREAFAIRPAKPAERTDEISAASGVMAGDQVAGVTPWDSEAPLRQQIKAAGALHTSGGKGTVALLVDDERLPATEETIELLSRAWRQTEIPGVRLVRRAQMRQQLRAPWEE